MPESTIADLKLSDALFDQVDKLTPREWRPFAAELIAKHRLAFTLHLLDKVRRLESQVAANQGRTSP